MICTWNNMALTHVPFFYLQVCWYYFDIKLRNIKMYHQQHLPPAASVPKPWTGASSAKRQWAPIRAPTPKVPSINNVVDFFNILTPPFLVTPHRLSNMSMKKEITNLKPVLTPHLWYKAMLKVWRKSWEPFRIYQLTSTANPAQFIQLWPNWLC